MPAAKWISPRLLEMSRLSAKPDGVEVDTAGIVRDVGKPLNAERGEGYRALVPDDIQFPVVQKVLEPDAVGVVGDLPGSPVRQVGAAHLTQVVLQAETALEQVARGRTGRATQPPDHFTQVDRAVVAGDHRIPEERVSAGIAAQPALWRPAPPVMVPKSISPGGFASTTTLLNWSAS